MEVLNKLFIHLQAARKASLEHVNLHKNIFLRLNLFALCVQQHVTWTCILKDPQTLTMKKRKCFYLK